MCEVVVQQKQIERLNFSKVTERKTNLKKMLFFKIKIPVLFLFLLF